MSSSTKGKSQHRQDIYPPLPDPMGKLFGFEYHEHNMAGINFLLDAGTIKAIPQDTLKVPLWQAESSLLNGAEDWEKFMLWMKLGSLRQAIESKEAEDLAYLAKELYTNQTQNLLRLRANLEEYRNSLKREAYSVEKRGIGLESNQPGWEIENDPDQVLLDERLHQMRGYGMVQEYEKVQWRGNRGDQIADPGKAYRERAESADRKQAYRDLMNEAQEKANQQQRFREREPFNLTKFEKARGYEAADENLHEIGILEGFEGWEWPHSSRTLYGLTFDEHTEYGLRALYIAADYKSAFFDRYRYLSTDRWINRGENERDKLNWLHLEHHQWFLTWQIKKNVRTSRKEWEDLEALVKILYDNRRKSWGHQRRMLDHLHQFQKHREMQQPQVRLSETGRAPQRFIFSLQELEHYTGFESEDWNVNELGILVSRDGPSAPYQPFRTCNVCFVSLIWKEFPDQITSACDHESTTCLTCLVQSINVQLQTLGTGNLECPSCKSSLDSMDLQKWCPSETFLRYSDAAFRNYLQNEPGFQHCLNSGCSSGQIHVGAPDQPMMTCAACGLHTCVNHQILYHTGIFCAEYDLKKNQQRAEEEVLTMQWITKETKPCPSCNVKIQFNGGCHHMTCGSRQGIAGCGHQFCWECLVRWSDVLLDWRKHKPSCKFRQPPQRFA